MKSTLNTVCAVALLFGAQAIADASDSVSNAWLQDAETDKERFELLQRYLRGFDQPMWEVGERYVAIHTALTRENLELANYHWEKIRVTIRNGYLKRPARRANSDAIFLDSLWGEVSEAFQSGDIERAWDGFDQAKAGCIACHAAEEVSFMNDQPMFELTR